MNRHRVSGWMTVAPLFVTPIAAIAATQHASHSLAQRIPNVQSATDYIYIDGFELPVDCTPVLTCPVPQSGKACISGRLTDGGSGAPLRALFKADLTCGGGAVGGPCDLALSAHDAFQFLVNPATDPPLASAETIVDGCGRFRFAGLGPPGGPYVAIVADDADPAPASDLHVPTATPHLLGANQRIDGVNVVSATRDTVNTWTQSAGSPFGASSFADIGVILFSFSAGGIPQAGVTVVKYGNPQPANDYYFSDASPAQRFQVDSTMTATGVNGAALFAGVNYASYSGMGGEPTGCVWPAITTSAATGVVLFVEIGC